MTKKLINEIEMSLLLDGVAWKADDFNEEEAEKVGDRKVSKVEKHKRDAHYRVRLTGKRNPSERTRDDYKKDSQKEINRKKREARLCGYKNHKYDLKFEDAMKNEISDFEYLKAEEERHERIRKEILDRTAKRAKELKVEALKMLIMAKELIDNSEKIMEEATKLEKSLKEDADIAC